MTRRPIFVAAALLLAIPSSRGQDETDRMSAYIDAQFQAAIGELPRLAWFLPDGTVAAQEVVPSIVLYSRANTAYPAHLRVTLSPDEIAALRQKHHVACDVLSLREQPVVSIYTTVARSGVSNPQILSTSREMPDLEVGFEQAPPRGRAETELWKQMQPADANQPRRAVQIRRRGLEFSYSLAALYSGPRQEVARIGMFLHAGDGKILAAHIGNIRGEWCDGCATPAFADGIERIYAVENMFTTSSFAYPVLMLDSSTMEGRAISLLTFTPSREYSRHLFYEYVVGCFEPPQPANRVSPRP